MIHTAVLIVPTIHTRIPRIIVIALIDHTVLTDRIVPITIMPTMTADISQDIPHTGTISHKSPHTSRISCNCPIGHLRAAGAGDLSFVSRFQVESLRAERQVSC
jgi:hypothetical protein